VLDGMDVLWAALGITLIVVFVFFVLAQYWQKLLRQHSRAIRQLAERVRTLEEVADPELRRRLGDAAPVPLEQVYTFSLRLGERFWRETIRASDADRQFIQEYGSFLASVKLERWRSHAVATVSEILPARKSAGLQTRTLDYYPNPAIRDEGLLLWELALARPSAPGLRPPSLELFLCGDALELHGPLPSVPAESASNGHAERALEEETLLLRLPLDPDKLNEYRHDDPGPEDAEDRADNGNANGAARPRRASSAGSWQAFYSCSYEKLGIEWELRLRDLSKKAEWERWHIWESGAIPVGND
jgi:hypothetical protein